MADPSCSYSLSFVGYGDLIAGQGGRARIDSVANGRSIGVVIIDRDHTGHGEREISYWLDPHFRKQGLMSGALQNVARNGLEVGWFETLYAKIYVSNIGSQKTVAYIGLKENPGKFSKTSCHFEASSWEVSDALVKRPLPKAELRFDARL